MMIDDARKGAPVPAVIVRDFGFRYPKQGEADAKDALNGVSFQVEQGAFCVMTGSTGSARPRFCAV